MGRLRTTKVAFRCNWGRARTHTCYDGYMGCENHKGAVVVSLGHKECCSG